MARRGPHKPIERVECKRCQKSVPKPLVSPTGLCRACASSPDVVLRTDMIVSAVMACCLLAVGVASFLWLRRWETGGGEIRMPALVAVLYQLVGSFGILGMHLLGAAAAGWRAFARGRELRRLER